MKHPWLFLLTATLCITASMAGPDRSIAGSGDIDLTQRTPPDIATVADDPFGTLVKYGYTLFTDTANEIGPTVSDPTRRFAGNNLACQNCHLQGGPSHMPCRSLAFGDNSRNTAREKARSIRSRIASTVAWSAA